METKKELREMISNINDELLWISFALIKKELKKGLGKDHHLTQVLRYMGWVRSKFVDYKEVSGILIASSFQKRIRFVIQELTRVSLLKYNLLFQLDAVKLK